MNSQSKTSNLMAAAITGILLGATNLAHADATSFDSGVQRLDEKDKSACKGKSGCKAEKPGKHACKGQNACKGQGGCKTDKHACKGHNACKGQGGCKTV